MPVRVGQDAIGVTNGVTIGGLSAQGAMEPAAERARGRPIPREAPQPRSMLLSGHHLLVEPVLHLALIAVSRDSLGSENCRNW